jgi:hypothetical protein
MSFNETHGNKFFQDYNSVIDEYVSHIALKLSEMSLEKEKIYESQLNAIEKTYNRFFFEGNNMLEHYKKENHINAWEFSVFDIIGGRIRKVEESIHSPILKELIDPNGTHAQGDLFFKLFLQTINKDLIVQNFTNELPEDYYASTEEYFNNDEEKGRMDIFIKSENIKKPFAVFIEVKWNSGDSSTNQLKKYWNNLRRTYNPEEIIVVYLTKHGEDPHDITNDFRQILNNNKGKNYFPISYNEHVLNWLKLCINKCKSHKVIHTIEQYKTLLEYDNSTRKKNLRARNKKRKF